MARIQSARPDHRGALQLGSGPARAYERASEGLPGAARGLRAPGCACGCGRLRVRAGRDSPPPARIGAGCAPCAGGTTRAGAARPGGGQGGAAYSSGPLPERGWGGTAISRALGLWPPRCSAAPPVVHGKSSNLRVSVFQNSKHCFDCYLLSNAQLLTLKVFHSEEKNQERRFLWELAGTRGLHASELL
ncbi:hypothetical protein R6Z07F_001665 [Ovis aries]